MADGQAPPPGPQPSWRKPAGVLLILLLIFVWCVLVATLAGPIGRLAWFVQAPVYLFLGIVWITPLKPLLRWIER